VRSSPRSARSSIALARTILVATGSPHKLAELRSLLSLPTARLASLAELGLVPDAPEEGATLRDNAVSKARWYARRSGLPTLADDSGLEVEALDGGPGVHTRRFAGPDADDETNNRKLLSELEGLPHDRRRARYRCVLAFLEPGAGGDEELIVCEGRFDGRIATAPSGSGGFGYDPIFEPADEPPGGRTVGTFSADEKNGVSHRAQAARAMAEVLRARGY
jgi:XTP/dITP diphosphohydrolase